MRDTVCFSWYSDMSIRTIACSSSNRNSASARASSVLPTPVGPRNRKLPSGRFGSCRPARARRIAFGDGVDGLVLADDALVQPLFHVDELLDFAFHQPADRDVRPLADDLGDVFLVDFLLQHAVALLELGQPALLPRWICCSSSRHACRTAARTPSRSRRRAARARSPAAALPAASFSLRRPLDRVLLLLPVRGEARAFFLEIGELLLELRRAAPSTPCPSPCAAPRARSRAA